jgi:hypothetical protein
MGSGHAEGMDPRVVVVAVRCQRAEGSVRAWQISVVAKKSAVAEMPSERIRSESREQCDASDAEGRVRT